MKLSFRGVAYNSKPSQLEFTEGEVGGKYRGVPWRVHRVQRNSHPHQSHTFTYRGVTYTKD